MKWIEPITLTNPRKPLPAGDLRCNRLFSEPVTNGYKTGFLAELVNRNEPKGERVGWIDGENLLLDPDAVFALAQGLGREQGNGLAINQKTLWKRMAGKGFLASREKGRNLQRWEIMGHRSQIIHISLDTLWVRNRDNRDNRDNQEPIR